jgi:hypothetical protein
MICGALGLENEGNNTELLDAVRKLPPRVGAELTRFAAMATSCGASILAVLSASVQPAYF